MKLKIFVRVTLAALGLGMSASSAQTQSTAFTYQGLLNSAGRAADGAFDMTFGLYASSTGGTAVVTILTNSAVVVSNGLFTTCLDFGSNTFSGAVLWLEIGVRTNGSTDPYTILGPRNALTAAPYALFASAASGSGIVGTLPDANLSTNIVRFDSDGSFTGAIQLTNRANILVGSFFGDASSLTNLSASNLTGVLTTTNPVVRGVASQAPDIASIVHFSTNDWGAPVVAGLTGRSLNPAWDSVGQTNWCRVLRSQVSIAGGEWGWCQVVPPTGASTSASSEFIFGFDGLSFVVFLRGSGSYMGLEVDGADDYSRILTPSDGALHYYTINFSSSARRQVGLKLSNNYQFGAIYLSPTNGLWPGLLPKPHRLIVVGDSFSEDTSSTSWTSCLMSLFFNLDVWSSAVGTTGYVNPGASGRVNFQTRILPDVVANQPEFVVFAGGINDTSTLTNDAAKATLESACLNCYQTIQSNLPNCKLAVLGPFWPRSPIDPLAYGVNQCISNACVSAGIGSNYIDTLSDPWVTGTWNQPGSGNAVNYTSSDATHPTPAGAWNIAYHVAAELARRFPELQPRSGVR